MTWFIPVWLISIAAVGADRSDEWDGNGDQRLAQSAISTVSTPTMMA
jgi:hypothetical protein